MSKFFKNYTRWCKFLGRKSNIRWGQSICYSAFAFHFILIMYILHFNVHICRLPKVKRDAQQYKLLYIGLYLLIWGEAANLRFMPECLCYIFHNVRCTSSCSSACVCHIITTSCFGAVSFCMIVHLTCLIGINGRE